jgi:hypothetical protein
LHYILHTHIYICIYRLRTSTYIEEGEDDQRVEWG